MAAGELGDGEIKPAADFARIHRDQPFQAGQGGPAFAGIHEQIGQFQQELGIIGAKLQFGPEPGAGGGEYRRGGS